MLFEGIKYAKAGNHLFDISGAIGRYAEERGYGVVRDLFVDMESEQRFMRHLKSRIMKWDVKV